MPKCYRKDLREKIGETYENKKGSFKKVAERFKVSLNTVRRIICGYRETGTVETYLHRVSRRELIDESGRETLRKLIKESPDVTLCEI